jgi:TolA-binding protein
VYEEAMRSLSALKQPLPDADAMFLSAEKEKSIIAAALARDARKDASVIVPFFRKEFIFLAAAALLVLSLISGAYLRGVTGRRTPRPAAAGETAAPPGAGIVSLTKDTTITFNRACALRAEAGADVSLQRRGARGAQGARVVHFTLSRGRILIAAHKGLYDTISVACGPATVFATGTHFSVLRTDSIVQVTVLEGAVKVLRQNPAREFFIESNETGNVQIRDSSWNKERLSPLLRRQLSDGFKAMSSVDFCMPQVQNADENQVLEPLSPAAPAEKSAYGKIRRMIRKGDYENALSGILKYLETDTADADVAYCDLALCYSNLGQWQNAVQAYAKASAATRDSLVREAILHRTNHILFSKLARYDEAGAGIRSYLSRYPNGHWHERELSMLKGLDHDRAAAPPRNSYQSIK